MGEDWAGRDSGERCAGGESERVGVGAYFEILKEKINTVAGKVEQNAATRVESDEAASEARKTLGEDDDARRDVAEEEGVSGWVCGGRYEEEK